MKLTPILYVRSWIAKLHPPMPTTPQENKQLLSLLSSSFERRLDNAHPPVRPKEPLAQATVPLAGPAVASPSARATIHHLHSLLQHPLLAQNTLHLTDVQSAASKAATMMDRAMLRGEADLEMVDKCMQLYIKTLQSGNMTIRDEFRLGRKISAWFTSSSAATKQKFLSSPAILRNAVPILYADGLEEAVWEWLGMLYSRNCGVGNSQQRQNPQPTTKPVQWILQESHLTFLMIKEALRRSRLDAAVLQFIQACAYMRDTGRMSSEARWSQPWQATINAVTIALLRRRQQHGLSAHLFDQFLEHRSSWSDPITFTFELISLYHPTRPSSKELAITIGQANDQIEAHFDRIEAMPDPAKKIILNALLDGAQLLLEQDSSSVRQARLILDLVEKQFPNLADQKSNEAAQKRIQSVRQNIPPPQFMPAAIGIT